MNLLLRFLSDVRRHLPYLITTILVFFWWKLESMPENYAFHYEGISKKDLRDALEKIFWIKMPFYVVLSNFMMLVFLKFLKKEKVIHFILPIIVFYLVGFTLIGKNCSNQYFSIFKNQNVPEGLVLRPLKQGGKWVCPLLTEYILDRNSHSRIYAILAIEMYEYNEATPILSSILNDTIEDETMRSRVYSVLLAFDSKDSKSAIIKFDSKQDSLSKAIVEMGKEFSRAQDFSVSF